ncbi:nucleotidyltransferase family protein [Sphingomonas bacterium]|uniref:nucleotidyltransferase family protein n=1 Tax=Sphingomonas bacterium TaxID=1895847 RepID=UPI00260C29B2|nr:nucleotidyltransferase family protein [Sphingomonas bacterium]MDB5677361.1 glycosyl transferase [Sphingomonas bacterium]
MIAPDTTALILLAAGKSARFGLSDKLTAMFLGQPLGMHAVTALEAVPFARRIVVKDGVELDYAARGYQVVRNPRPEDGLSLSVRLGVQAARGDGIEAVLIALADMPRITATHVHRLFDTQHGANSVVASSDGVRPRPPVLFGSGRFDALERLEGDAGARDVIRAGRHVVASPDELVDVDTQQELDELLAKFGQTRA